jgi:hypothetical protein
MNVTVEFSESAPVHVDARWWYAPFQRNSYTARVEFPDGFVAVIALPEDARREGADHYLDRVLVNAALMHAAGVSTGLMKNDKAKANFEAWVERVPRYR